MSRILLGPSQGIFNCKVTGSNITCLQARRCSVRKKIWAWGIGSRASKLLYCLLAVSCWLSFLGAWVYSVFATHSQGLPATSSATSLSTYQQFLQTHTQGYSLPVQLALEELKFTCGLLQQCLHLQYNIFSGCFYPCRREHS